MTHKDSLERLGDRYLQDFVLVNNQPEDERTNWSLLVGDGGDIVAAWAPGTEGPCGAVVIADADLEVDQALRTDAFRMLEPDDAVLVMKEGALAGVWAGSDLRMALMSGPSRYEPLAGEIQIPEVTLFCRFEESMTACGSPLTVEAMPAEWPECPNPNHLQPHVFLR